MSVSIVEDDHVGVRTFVCVINTTFASLVYIEHRISPSSIASLHRISPDIEHRDRAYRATAREIEREITIARERDREIGINIYREIDRDKYIYSKITIYI